MNILKKTSKTLYLEKQYEILHLSRAIHRNTEKLLIGRMVITPLSPKRRVPPQQVLGERRHPTTGNQAKSQLAANNTCWEFPDCKTIHFDNLFHAPSDVYPLVWWCGWWCGLRTCHHGGAQSTSEGRHRLLQIQR